MLQVRLGWRRAVLLLFEEQKAGEAVLGKGLDPTLKSSTLELWIFTTHPSVLF